MNALCAAPVLIYENNAVRIWDFSGFPHIEHRRKSLRKTISQKDVNEFWRHYDRCAHSPAAIGYLVESYM